MKLREIVMLLGGMITLLLFVSYMFDFYQRTSELNLLKRDMYFDSLILVEQQKLKEKDSLFEIHTTLMDSFQNEAIKKKMTKKDREVYEKQLDTIPK